MKVEAVSAAAYPGQRLEGILTHYSEARNPELHLIFRDGYAIVNYMDGTQQISHAYPVATTTLSYVIQK